MHLPLVVGRRRQSQVGGDELPVQQVIQEALDAARAFVAVVDIVSVLPDIEREQRHQIALNRVLRVVAVADEQLATHVLAHVVVRSP